MIQRKHVSVPSTPNRQHDRKSSKSLQKYKAKHSVQPKLRKKILKYATYAAIKNETASYWLPCSKLCCLLKHRCWVSSYMNTQILQVFCLLKKTQMLKPPYAVFFAYLSLCLSAIGLHCSTEKRGYWLPHPPPKKNMVAYWMLRIELYEHVYYREICLLATQMINLLCMQYFCLLSFSVLPTKNTPLNIVAYILKP